MPKPHNRAELGFKRPSAQLPSPEHAGLWATSWHRQPVALSLILRRGARHACPRRAALVALGGLSSTPWAAARALDLDRRLVPALTTWRRQASVSPRSPHRDTTVSAGVPPAPPSGVGLGVVTWRGAGSPEPRPARSRTPGPPPRRCLEPRALRQPRAPVGLGTRRCSGAAEVRGRALAARRAPGQLCRRLDQQQQQRRLERGRRQQPRQQ